jgi:aminopeptidase N
MTATQYERLGWDVKNNEDENDTKLRSLIISLSLYAEVPAAQDEATQRFKASDIDELDAELRGAIMAHMVRTAGKDTALIDTLLKAYSGATNSELRDDIAAALTSTRNEAVVERLSELLKDASIIRPQDFTHWFAWLIRNRYARSYMWQWTQDNWAWIEKTFKDDSHYDMLPRYIASALVTRSQLEEYKTFFAPLEAEVALSRNITIGYTEIEGIVTMLESDGPNVRQALLDLNET